MPGCLLNRPVRSNHDHRLGIFDPPHPPHYQLVGGLTMRRKLNGQAALGFFGGGLVALTRVKNYRQPMSGSGSITPQIFQQFFFIVGVAQL